MSAPLSPVHARSLASPPCTCLSAMPFHPARKFPVCSLETLCGFVFSFVCSLESLFEGTCHETVLSKHCNVIVLSCHVTAKHCNVTVFSCHVTVFP
jgi:hypothetical protein